MKKSIVFVLFTIFVLTSCTTKNDVKNDVKIEEKEQVKYVTTMIVEEKGFFEQIKLPGKISASKETSISSLSSGIIDKVNVKVGDRVKAGDILATIDTKSNLANINLNNAITLYNNSVSVYNTTKASLEKSIEAAKLQYDNAKIARDNTYTSTEKQLELSKTQLDSALTQKGNTTTSSDTNLDLAEKSLENARINLENFLKTSEESRKSLETKKKSVFDTLKVTIEGSFIALDSSLTAIDEILGVTDLNKHLNDDYEIYLGAKNSIYKNESETLFSKSNAKFKTLKDKYNSNFVSQVTEQDLISYYNELLGLVNDNIILLDKMVLMLNNTIISAGLDENGVNTMKTKIVTFQSQSSTLKGNLINFNSSYNDIIDSISSTDTNLVTQKATLEQAVKVAEATYNNTKAGINTNLDSMSSSESTARIQYETTLESVKSSRETADKSLEIALNQYNAAKASYDVQLATLKSQIDGNAGQRNTLSQQIENSQIKAPYDGIIISKNIEVGSSIGQGTTAFIIANSSAKIVKLEVNSENVKHLNVGKEVELKKDNLTSTGVISLVGAGLNNDISMYPIEVTFDDVNFGNNVILGDFVDIYINKEVGSEKFIIIPFSALVAASNGVYHVFIVNNDNLVVKKDVSVGANNSTEVIITSGLNVGDKIIINGTLNVNAGDKVEDRK